jgi:uncharacterized protein YjgD (DUF1641 family)
MALAKTCITRVVSPPPRRKLKSSDEVIEIAVDVAKSPGSIRSLCNMLLMVSLLGAIDPEDLKAFTRTVPQALKLMAQRPEPPGLWKLMKDSLWDQNVRRGLSASNVLLESFGRTLDRKSGHG